MKLQIIILICTICMSLPTLAQEEISLQYCQAKGIEVSPLQKQKLYYESLMELSNQSTNAINLPQLVLNGQFSFQSDVFSLPFDVPGIESPIIPKNQYKVGVDFYQNIYNGGRAKSLLAINASADQINQQTIEISLYKVHKIINRLYFSVLLTQEQIELLNSTMRDLQVQKDFIDSRVNAGTVLRGSTLVIQKEMLSLIQMIIELEVRKETSKELLGSWIEEDIKTVDLLLPTGLTSENSELNRPEIKLFDYKMDVFQSQIGLINSNRIPDVGIFGTAGIGYPNPLNWFNVTHSPYALVGVKLSWKILDYGISKNERESAQLRQQIVLAEKENYLKILNNSVTNLESEVRKYNQLILKDNEIIQLQDEILAQSTSQLQNGTLTSANYIIEVSKGLQAKLNKKIHEIKLSEAYINILTETGNIGEL